MNKVIVMPALLLAGLFVAASARAAGHAQMPGGNPHQLRQTIDIRSADKGNWKNNKIVTLTAGGNDPQCTWKKPPSPLKSLDGAQLLIDTDAAGNPSMLLIFKDKTWIKRPMTFGGAAGEQTWLSSTPGNDWNYFVLFLETKKGAKPPALIDKLYHVEIFPPEAIDADVKQHCDPERPDHAVTVASAAGSSKGQPCQSGSGSGYEPH